MRTQPAHIGHINMLELACQKADEVIIAIGSANKLNEKNPYTAYERKLILEKSLQDKGIENYRFVTLNDYDNDNDWYNEVLEKINYSKECTILSGNPWVEEIFTKEGYNVESPEKVIGNDLIDISATKLREFILKENPLWEKYAATGTKYYFERFGGKERIEKFYKEAVMQ